MTCPRRFTNRPRAAAAMIIIVSSTMASGCARPFNEPIDLVGTEPLPALVPAGGTTELTGRPSLLRGIDRRGWDLVTINVPTHQVAHYPTYAKNFRWEQDREPWNPAYPTAADSIVDPVDAGQDFADGVTAPVHAAAMLLWAPVDMLLGNWPWSSTRSPGEPYAVVPPRRPAELWDWFAAEGGDADIQWTDSPGS